MAIVTALGTDAAEGAAFSSGLVTQFVITPVPEPSALVLLAAGLLLLARLGVRAARQ